MPVFSFVTDKRYTSAALDIPDSGYSALVQTSFYHRNCVHRQLHCTPLRYSGRQARRRASSTVLVDCAAEHANIY